MRIGRRNISPRSLLRAAGGALLGLLLPLLALQRGYNNINMPTSTGSSSSSLSVLDTPTDIPTDVSTGNGMPHYLFLHDSWEQFNAGKATFADYAYLAVLSGRVPVIPFLSNSGSAFVGHADDPRASIIDTTHEITFGHIPALFESFATAHEACKSTTMVHVNHSKNTTDAACPDKNSRSWNSTQELWKPQHVKCVNTHAINITDLIDETSNCVVLVDFHGLWNRRGSVIWGHSPAAVQNHRWWEFAKSIISKYYDAWMSESKNTLGPLPSHLVRAASCIHNEWKHIPAGEYDVLQFRLESVSIQANRQRGMWATNTSFIEFFSSCIQHAVQVLKDENLNNERHVVVLADVGSKGSSTFHYYPGIPRSVDKLYELIGLPSILTTETCNKDCVGPTCFMLDEAIFLIAETAVQLPGGGNSAGQMWAARRAAHKNTTIVRPNYTAVSNECPFYLM